MSTSEDRSGASGRVQQAPGLWRTNLQQHDLSVPGARSSSSASTSARTRHRPSTPIRAKRSSTSSKGSLEYQIEGQPTRTCHAGGALTVPAGAIHAVRNADSGNAAELATYVIEKGKPVLTLAE
jgi:hypothetical protein